MMGLIPNSINLSAAKMPAGPAPTTTTCFANFFKKGNVITSNFLVTNGSFIKTLIVKIIQTCCLLLASILCFTI